MARYAGRFVVDTHCHPQRAVVKFAERGIKTPSTREMYAEVADVQWHDNSERLLYDMERYGIDLCILMSGGLARGMDNDLDVEIAARNPEKFAVLCYPTRTFNQAARGEELWTFEGALKETEDRLKTGKYVGIGQGLPITELGYFADWWALGDEKKKEEVLSEEESLDRYRMFMDLAASFEVAVAGMPHERGVTDRLAAEYPSVPIILQLVGWGHRASQEKIREVCTLASFADNIYLEMGFAPAELYEIPLSDPNIGPTRIVFGTDWGAQSLCLFPAGPAYSG